MWRGVSAQPLHSCPELKRPPFVPKGPKGSPFGPKPPRNRARNGGRIGRATYGFLIIPEAVFASGLDHLYPVLAKI